MEISTLHVLITRGGLCAACLPSNANSASSLLDSRIQELIYARKESKRELEKGKSREKMQVERDEMREGEGLRKRRSSSEEIFLKDQDSQKQSSGVSPDKQPELHRVNSFKETTNPDTAAIANQCVLKADLKQDDPTKEDTSSTMQEGEGARDVKGAKLVYDKGVSVKQYVMNKLEPGKDDKTLSKAITEAVSSHMGGQAEESDGVDVK